MSTTITISTPVGTSPRISFDLSNARAREALGLLLAGQGLIDINARELYWRIQTALLLETGPLAEAVSKAMADGALSVEAAQIPELARARP